MKWRCSRQAVTYATVSDAPLFLLQACTLNKLVACLFKYHWRDMDDGNTTGSLDWALHEIVCQRERASVVRDNLVVDRGRRIAFDT